MDAQNAQSARTTQAAQDMQAARDTQNTQAPHLVLLGDVIPSIIQEIRYHSSYNFVGARVDGYEHPVALMTEEGAAALARAARAFEKQGLCLRIYDAYRPQRAVDHFVRWAADTQDTSMKQAFYPDVDKKDLFDLHYIARKSSHSRGSTVDLTLVDMASGSNLDMGSPFDFFGEISHPDSDLVGPQQQTNRARLAEGMHDAGFDGIPSEWWHFTLRNEPYPDIYFDVPVRCKQTGA